MAIFPSCSFEVLVPNGFMVAGDRLEGALILEAPEPIARAEKILLTIESIAFASYGKSGVEKVMFQAPLQFDLPKDLPFAAG